MRDEARDPLWVLADFAPRELENRDALQWAGDVLAALAPFVVLRSEMEQVGTRSKRSGRLDERIASDPRYDSVYIVRAGGGEDQQ